MYSGIVVTLHRKLTVAKLEQNAKRPALVNDVEYGIVILVRPVQYENAKSPISVRVLGRSSGEILAHS